MAKVFITYPFSEDWIKELLEKHDCEVYPETSPPTVNEIKKRIKDKDAILCLLRDPINREVIDEASALKVISNYAVGYDNIDVEYASSKGIVVTNTPDILTNATAELALSLVFALIRRIVEADRFTREGRFEGWLPELFLGMELSGSTVGVVGAGRIGSSFAEKVMKLGASVIYFSRRRKEHLEKLGARKVELEELLKKSDIISLHLPLTSETHHIIGEKEFQMMGGDTFLVNTGRGALIDEIALAEALASGRIAGAALDVYEYEPGITTSLLKMDNVVLTPHIGSATYRARKGMAEIAVKNIILTLEGKEPLYRVK
ncbi:D-glycerate dehydrogenase [bacterium]|nr:MAG: D-glycerate dehydrogenase [bacterium]